MRVAVVDGDISYPPTSGKRLRTLNLMLPLARRHELTYLCRGQANGPEAAAATKFLDGHGIRTVVVDQPVARKAGPLFYGRLLANLFSPLPYSVASHLGSTMQQAVSVFARENKVDLWHFEWSAYVESLDRSRTEPIVISAPNVDSVIWQRYFENENKPLRRWYVRKQWQKFEKFERRIFQRAHRVVACTQDDATVLQEHFGVRRVEVVDNGVDIAYYGNVQGDRLADRLLYVGALDWRPNLDALDVLLSSILPAVRKEVPTATLCIVGRKPSSDLIRRVQKLQGVELHADVADVRPFLASSGLLAVPLRIGGGSRLKILEALASGLPVISTRVGAEGLALTPGKDLVVVENMEEMAPKIVDAIRHPESIRDMARHGREVVRARYDWSGLADKLELVWEAAAGDASLQSEIACMSST
jgi:glycosyltransferase involved in cell wall biosynthesis